MDGVHGGFTSSEEKAGSLTVRMKSSELRCRPASIENAGGLYACIPASGLILSAPKLASGGMNQLKCHERLGNVIESSQTRIFFLQVFARHKQKTDMHCLSSLIHCKREI